MNVKSPNISGKQFIMLRSFSAGINIENSGSTDVAMLHEDLIDVMPAVEEANSISEELDKRVKFEIILIAPNMLGKLKHKHEGFEDRDKTSSQPEVSLLFQSGLVFTNYVEATNHRYLKHFLFNT